MSRHIPSNDNRGGEGIAVGVVENRKGGEPSYKNCKIKNMKTESLDLNERDFTLYISDNKSCWQEIKIGR